jgi:putative exosortase-associated protein (TIGR04073 family)
MKALTLAALLLASLLLAPPADAQTAARKFGRGLAAMVTGFLEVPGNMVAETREHGAAMGLPLGFAKGLGMIVVRELVGVYEFLSAPFPAPAGFRPIIEPEFPWSYFERQSSRSTPRERPPAGRRRTAPS